MRYSLILIVSIFALVAHACNKKEDLTEPETGYPLAIEAIIINKCANSGCHNYISNFAAAGLNLDRWENLFKGSNGGAVIIPFRPDFSTLCYYINTDTSQGIALQPTMPVNQPPLTNSEYNLLKTWIENGAPNKNGFVKFSDYQNKSKLYMCNRGCDVVTILDPQSGLAMRYIDVGNNPAIEGPCMIKVSPDKLYWYVIFNQGTTIQKFRTADNVKVGELTLVAGFWTTLVITSDSK